ncbi:hypothetical protein PR002_g21457 [Phytophthora rubi]|nr:hypothetical protein PR002_g21457 [Phytophthora rubi]
MPAFNLTVPLGYQHYFLSTDDAYDGVYDASLSTSGSTSSNATSESSKYKTVFIVFLVLFVVAVAITAFFVYRWYKLKRDKADQRTTEDLQQHIEISSPVQLIVK